MTASNFNLLVTKNKKNMKSKIHENRKNNIKLIAKIFLFNLILVTKFCVAQAPANAPIIPMSNNLGARQLTLADNGSYYKDDANRMNFWAGTWKYTIGDTEFKIVFTKVNGLHITPEISKSNLDYYTDKLNGGYYYKENGNEITDHLLYSDQIMSPLITTGIYGTNSSIVKLRIFYQEFEKNPNLICGWVNFTLLPGSTTQAKWEFQPGYRKNYSVPDNIILTKE